MEYSKKNIMQFKADKIDRKILRELDWNARIKNSEIAKKVNLSKKGVEYRINKLETSGVIEGYYPVINFLKLGYKYCRTLIKLQYLNESIKKEIEEFVKSEPNYNWSIWAFGEYDLVIGSWTKTFKEFKENIDKLQLKFDKQIKLIKYSFAYELDSFPYDFLLEDKINSRKKRVMKEVLVNETIDKTDFLIINELIYDARKSVLDISKKLKLNSATVKQRIDKLISKEILLMNRASINEINLGYNHYKILLQLTRKNKEDTKKLIDFLELNKNFIYLVPEIGLCDLDFEMMFASTKDFLDFMDEIQLKFASLIKDYESFIFTKTIKVNFMPASLKQEFLG
ncbi:MAG: Lrp/AsnC family transcriptional regulator [Candidatus Nanoarchaeia archaeon]